jgi:hypothetical protein
MLIPNKMANHPIGWVRMGRSALGVNQFDLPGGLPRGAPRASRASSAGGGEGMLHPGYRVIGLRQVDGIPHNSQRIRSS